MLPQISMEGRVGTDPTLHFSTSGTAVCKFRMAASSRKKEGDEWVDDKTTWLTVTTFGKHAENVAESIVKSDLIVVAGRLQMDEYEKDGVKHVNYEVIADSLGPSLRWRTVKHGEPASTPAEPTAPVGGSDEPPF